MELVLWQTRFREYMQLRQWSPRTIATYTAELRPFFAFLAEQGVTGLGGVTRETVEGYRTWLFYARYRGRRLTLRCQATRLSALKAFLRFLFMEHFLLADPGAGVELPRVPRALPRAFLSEEQATQLIEAPDVTTSLGLRDRAVLEVLYGTAIRNTELCRLSLDEVDLERRELRIHQGKGGKSRVVPLGEEAQAWLEAYLEKGRPSLLRSTSQQFVFLSWRGRGMTRTALAAVVSRAGRAAGIERVVTPHVLRHCCATHMLRRGAGIRHLQELLGHECLSTTQRYTHVEVSDLRRVLARCHPREGGPAPS